MIGALVAAAIICPAPGDFRHGCPIEATSPVATESAEPTPGTTTPADPVTPVASPIRPNETTTDAPALGVSYPRSSPTSVELPRTGANDVPLVALGLLLVGAGAGAVVVSRRYR